MRSLHDLIFDFFFFNDTATTEIYTLSLHDALPIWRLTGLWDHPRAGAPWRRGERWFQLRNSGLDDQDLLWTMDRSEEHTSELQSRQYLVCRLLLEKKKKK